MKKIQKKICEWLGLNELNYKNESQQDSISWIFKQLEMNKGVKDSIFEIRRLIIQEGTNREEYNSHLENLIKILNERIEVLEDKIALVNKPVASENFF